MWQTRERKQRVLSPLHSMFFLISVCIVLYRHKKSGHHLVTKVSKIIVLLYTSMCKKVSISKVFYSLILFDSKKSNTIFYSFVYHKQKAAGPCLLAILPKNPLLLQTLLHCKTVLPKLSLVEPLMREFLFSLRGSRLR